MAQEERKTPEHEAPARDETIRDIYQMLLCSSWRQLRLIQIYIENLMGLGN